MSTARERVHTEACKSLRDMWDEDVFFDSTDDAYKDGFLAGRTVTAEQVEPVAVRLFLMNDDRAPWAVTDESTKQAYRSAASDLFTAAGFIVEEEC